MLWVSVVNKAWTLKAKAKAKAWICKAKTKAKAWNVKAKAKAVKFGLEAKAKALTSLDTGEHISFRHVSVQVVRG